jgi:hypothetical protein
MRIKEKETSRYKHNENEFVFSSYTALETYTALKSRTLQNAIDDKKPIVTVSSVEVKKRATRDSMLEETVKKEFTPRIEKKEYPVIKVTRKPSKRKMAKRLFVQTYTSIIDNSVVIGKITPLEHGMTEVAKTACQSVKCEIARKKSKKENEL